MARVMLCAAIFAAVICCTGLHARAQDGPSFDCHKASSKIEHALCDADSGLGPLDRTMADLYRAALKQIPERANALRAEQHTWLAQRDSCTGPDKQLFACLLKSYHARFAEIAAPYDPAHVTGRYSARDINGTLDAVLFPGQTVTVQIDSNRGPPSYNMCDVSFTAPLAGGHAHYVMPPDEDQRSEGEPPCTVDLTAQNGKITVEHEGCSALCGYGADFAGTYQRK